MYRPTSTVVRKGLYSTMAAAKAAGRMRKKMTRAACPPGVTAPLAALSALAAGPLGKAPVEVEVVGEGVDGGGGLLLGLGEREGVPEFEGVWEALSVEVGEGGEGVSVPVGVLVREGVVEGVLDREGVEEGVEEGEEEGVG